MVTLLSNLGAAQSHSLQAVGECICGLVASLAFPSLKSSVHVANSLSCDTGNVVALL